MTTKTHTTEINMNNQKVIETFKAFAEQGRNAAIEKMEDGSLVLVCTKPDYHDVSTYGFGSVPMSIYKRLISTNDTASEIRKFLANNDF